MQIDLSWRPALAAGVFCVAAVQALAAAPIGTASDSSRVEVNFRDPDRFIDIGPDRRAQAEWMADLRAHLQRRAAKALPAGDRLAVTITDAARAGHVHHGVIRDTRIVRDDFPPASIDLDFQLLSPTGEVQKSGSRRLGDLGLRYRIADSGGAAALENRLIDDWVRREFDPDR